MRENWILVNKKESFLKLSEFLDENPLVLRLLANRGIDDINLAKRFLKGTIEDLYDGYLMKDMKKGVSIIKQAIDKKIPYGVYHATNQGYTTWYDFTKAILEKQGIQCKVNPVTTEEYIEMMKITQAKRPFNSQLSKDKLLAQGINVPSWEDGLNRYLNEE